MSGHGGEVGKVDRLGDCGVVSLEVNGLLKCDAY